MTVEAATFTLLGRLWREKNGQDLIEYSLLIMFIAITCMWFIGAGGPKIRGVWTGANSTVDEASTAAAQLTAAGAQADRPRAQLEWVFPRIV